MNTEQIWETESTSLENTLQVAERIGSRLKGGEIIELVSDLGGGKTVFVRGLVKGTGSHDTVSSPSFTISNQYEAGELTIHHFDFYRLNEAGILEQEVAELISDPRAVVVIEWADIIEKVLPEDHLRVSITPTGENSRKLIFTYPTSYSYLFEGMDT
jgi:tRNA threonylcarbamoyladenosine biosynthesis protein TsaE